MILLPLPTTCCWVPMEINQKWTYLQYFILLDVGMANAISPSQFVDGIKHLTSRSSWVSKDGKAVTLQPPGLMSNFAW